MSTQLGTCSTQNTPDLPYVQSVQPGTNVTVDDTDPRNPIVSATGGGGSGFNYVDESTTYSASVNDYVLTDTSGGAFTVTLPTAPANGATVVVADAANAWGNTGPDTPITIAAGGSDLILYGNSTASTYGSSVYGATIKLTYYVADTWWILEFIEGTTSGSVAAELLPMYL